VTLGLGLIAAAVVTAGALRDLPQTVGWTTLGMLILITALDYRRTAGRA